MPQPPNIVLFMTDQQRFDTIRALGNDVIRTPVLDDVVRRGVAFTRAYTPSPVCVSARCALLTGLEPQTTGCTDNAPMDLDRPSLMQRLAAANYQCYGAGKMHFVPAARALWGFDERCFCEEGGGPDDFRTYLDEHGYSHVLDPHGVRSEYYYLPQPSQLPERHHATTYVIDRSIEWLQARDRTRPFFLCTSIIKPHPPFEAPTPWNKLYRANTMPLPYLPEGYRDLLTYWNHHQNRYKWRDRGWDINLLRTMKAAYYACISFIDFGLGRLLEELDVRGDLANTLVLFTSDHGELLGDYGSFGKRCMLDSAARIPLLAMWPDGLAAGQSCAEPASLIDIAPTCLASAGLPRTDLPGADLRLLASGGLRGDAAYSQFQSAGNAVVMRATRDHKYIWSAPDQREWLFEASPDGRESVDLAADSRCSAILSAERAQTLRHFAAADFVDGASWRVYPKRAVPPDPDAGVLFQDPPASVVPPYPRYGD